MVAPLAPPPLPPPTPSLRERMAGAREALGVAPATLRLVREADASGLALLALLALVGALLPAALAWVAKLIVDAVVVASRDPTADAVGAVLRLVALELALGALQLGVARGIGLRRELLRAALGNAVNERVLQKALSLEIRQFEEPAVYDRMQNARREASTRPLSFVAQIVAGAQGLVTLASLSGLLWRVSPASVAVVLAASVPAFLAEARLSAESFKLWSWRAPEGRRLNYLEWLLTRDGAAREVRLFDLGPLLLGRYRDLYRRFFAEDRRIALRRLRGGVLFGLLALGAFYAMYALMAARAARGALGLGDLVLYVAVFRQAQQAVQSVLGAVGGLYEDALFMTGLFDFLALPTGGARPSSPAATLPRGRPLPIEFDRVSFRYPGRPDWALREVSLTVAPGETLGLVGENGAGKSTLVKLLLGFYEPTEGTIRYGGVDLRRIDRRDLWDRVGAVFQDFVRYQFTAGENVGIGLPAHIADPRRVAEAARRAGAEALLAGLPRGADTSLGSWFDDAQELSAGQWQKLAVARAFMREEAELLVLDEPTAAIDAAAEHELFQRFRELAAGRSAIVISHRFSTVRMADRIAVLHGGKVEELGTHRELVARGGRYATLFALQARGYLD